MARKAKTDRNRRIKASQKDGESTRKIGSEFKISNKRVWEIEHAKAAPLKKRRNKKL